MTEHESVTVPVVVSLLVCDQVIDDRLSNKKSAIGIFNMILVPKVPTVIQQLAILASLTEFDGQADVELRLVRDSDNEILFSGGGQVNAPSPLAVVDLLFALQGVQIAESGQYAFELLSGGEILGRRRFQVHVRRPGSGPPPGFVGLQAPPDSDD